MKINQRKLEELDIIKKSATKERVATMIKGTSTPEISTPTSCEDQEKEIRDYKEKMQFYDDERTIISQTPTHLKLDFIKSAQKFYGLTEKEAYRLLKETIYLNNKRGKERRKANKQTKETK